MSDRTDRTRLNYALGYDLPKIIKELEPGEKSQLICSLGDALVKLIGIDGEFFTWENDALYHIILTSIGKTTMTNPLTLNQYQQLALRTWKDQPTDMAILNAALGFGESGEAQGVVKKWYFHGHDLDQKELLKEIGDQLYYCAVMCKELGFTLEEVAMMNVRKLMDRYPDGFSTERSINRSE